MKFFDFLESKYASTNISCQKEYTNFKHAETQAYQNLINAQRSFFKYFTYLTAIFHFIGIKLHIFEAIPTKTEIIEKMIADKNAEADKAKQDAIEKQPVLSVVNLDQSTS